LEYDTFIHKNFFADRRMVALVVDPLAGKRGWFEWRGEEVVPTVEAPTTRGGAKAADSRAGVAGAAAGARRSVRAALPAAAAFALMCAIGGYVLGMRTADTGQAAASVTVADVDADALRRQAQNARAETDSTKAQVAKLEVQLKTLQEQAQAAAPVATSFEYTIREGDTVWAIAEFMYGDGASNDRILKANPDVHAGNLRIGTSLLVPFPDTTRKR